MQKVICLFLCGWLLVGCAPDSLLSPALLSSLTPEAIAPKPPPTPWPTPSPLTPEEVAAILPEVGLFGQNPTWQISPEGGYASWESANEIKVVTANAEHILSFDPLCEVHWYDKALLACGGHFIYFNRDRTYTELPVFVWAAAAIDPAQVLATARQIYRYRGQDILAVLLGEGDQAPSHLTIIREVAQIELLLADYPHTVVSVIPPADQVENVEVVASRQELGHQGKWNLSPAGDKLVYQVAVNQAIILLPATGHRYTIRRGCNPPTWLDNIILKCGTTRINMADLIEGLTEPAQVGEVTQRGSSSLGDHEKKIYSPNGRYYYLVDLAGFSLTIYDAETDQQLSQFHLGSYPTNYSFSRAGGWASDSSGVYFQTAQTGLFLVPLPPFSHHSDIRKLVVP